MTNEAANIVGLDIHLSDSGLGSDIEAWLADSGAQDVHLRDERGVVPLLPIVITALVTIYTLAHLAMWIRSRTQCQVIIDARARRIRKEIDCRVRDGRLIILAQDNIKIEVVGAAADDLTSVVAAAMSGEAADVVAAATKFGVTARALP